MQFIDDIMNFLKTLSFVDVVFFFAVLALMLLIIVLIYFIRENRAEEEMNFPSQGNNLPPKNDNNNDEITSLKEITEALENAEPSAINLNKYEEDQEEKAIISYDELLKRKNDFAINYSEEESLDDDLTVKKVDLDNLINKEVRVKPEIKVSVISYEKEEAFLEALKKLQQTLN
ncbi:MAG TPA: hypothetical protein IAB49_02590 [Candidatus Caccenecus avistercoris]|nr:hypothetical protein [Candidatus Caccenecus avistercoris]